MIALMADDCGALELSTLVWYIDGTRHPQPIKGGIGSSKNQVTCAWRGGGGTRSFARKVGKT